MSYETPALFFFPFLLLGFVTQLSLHYFQVIVDEASKVIHVGRSWRPVVQGSDGAPAVLRSPSKTSRVRTKFQHFSLNQILRSSISIFRFVIINISHGIFLRCSTGLVSDGHFVLFYCYGLNSSKGKKVTAMHLISFPKF